LWERLSASIIAAGKPLPQKKQNCNAKKLSEKDPMAALSLRSEMLTYYAYAPFSNLGTPCPWA
jgi:hypothetical protein